MTIEQSSSGSDAEYTQALVAVERARAIRHELVGAIDNCQQMLYLLERADDTDRARRSSALSDALRAMRDRVERLRLS
jgi:hypothetical protein